VPAFLNAAIGLYLDPPDTALVLCCDEKSQVQALERTQLGLPVGIGHIRTQSHDYMRHGTVTLFTALDYLKARLISCIERQHRHQEWLELLKKINRETPKHLQLHLIVDNYATPKHPKVKAWLEKHKRFHMHFTPTSRSWMNMVERFLCICGRAASAQFANWRARLPRSWHCEMRSRLATSGTQRQKIF
jgi:transposase